MDEHGRLYFSFLSPVGILGRVLGGAILQIHVRPSLAFSGLGKDHLPVVWLPNFPLEVSKYVRVRLWITDMSWLSDQDLLSHSGLGDFLGTAAPSFSKMGNSGV